MRFGLLALFVLTTVVAGTLALCLRDGVFGVVLAAPTLLAVLACLGLVRRGYMRTAISLSGLYVLCWLATANWALAGVDEHFAAQRVQGFLGKPGESYAVVKSWSANPAAPRNREIWYYVENVAYPCPLLVAVDYRIMTLGSVEGGRAYVLWLFGYERVIGYRGRWLGCG